MRATVAGEELELLAERAIWWAAARTLFVADVHIGKAESFQRAGVPVPSDLGMTEIERLEQLIIRLRADDVWVLGDLVHDEMALSPGSSDRLAALSRNVGHCRLHLVRGNHDRHVPSFPEAWRFETHSEGTPLGPFELRHHPASGARYVLAGHLHPTHVVRGAGDVLRLPCFHFGAEVGVLPAFTSFSNGLRVDASTGAVFVIAGHEVIAI